MSERKPPEVGSDTAPVVDRDPTLVDFPRPFAGWEAEPSRDTRNPAAARPEAHRAPREEVSEPARPPNDLHPTSLKGLLQRIVRAEGLPPTTARESSGGACVAYDTVAAPAAAERGAGRRDATDKVVIRTSGSPGPRAAASGLAEAPTVPIERRVRAKRRRRALVATGLGVSGAVAIAAAVTFWPGGGSSTAASRELGALASPPTVVPGAAAKPVSPIATPAAVRTATLPMGDSLPNRVALPLPSDAARVESAAERRPVVVGRPLPGAPLGGETPSVASKPARGRPGPMPATVDGGGARPAALGTGNSYLEEP